MSERLHISTTERVKIFERNGGHCHLCDHNIFPGEAWDVSHEIPLANGGEDSDENRRVAHRKCHRLHTATVDQPAIAKSKRVHAKHIGAHRTSRPISGWKKFNGDPVRNPRVR